MNATVEVRNLVNTDVSFERAFGIELDPNPWYNKLNWGSEAMNGYSIHLNLNTIICPDCRKRIYPQEIRHKMNRNGKWSNHCRHCNPKLETAMEMNSKSCNCSLSRKNEGETYNSVGLPLNDN